VPIVWFGLPTIAAVIATVIALDRRRGSMVHR
jgi:hypothetical protein